MLRLAANGSRRSFSSHRTLNQGLNWLRIAATSDGICAVCSKPVRLIYARIKLNNNDNNIAFVNSERWLAKSRVDITLCQHGKFPTTLLLKFFVLYYKRNIKHFFRIGIQLYQHSWKLEKLEIVWKHSALRASCFHTISRFPNSTRVDVTVYQHGKCFIYLNNKPHDFARSRVSCTYTVV